MFNLNQSKKRKITDECRVFNKEWTKKYLFVDFSGKAVCLICKDTIAILKEYNLKRHFNSKHLNLKFELNEQELEKKANELVLNLKKQQIKLFQTSLLQYNATLASFILAYKVAKQKKPFSDGEFIKDCIVDAIKIVFPESCPKVEAISFTKDNQSSH